MMSVATGILNYLRPSGRPNRRFVAPGAEMNTGVYDPHVVAIRDARGSGATLDSHGFQLVAHQSAVSDFHDAAEIDRLYPAEAEALIRSVTGADLVIPFGWMRRTSDPVAGGAIQPPASDVHVDLTRDRAERVAGTFLERAGRSDFRHRRFLITSLWRAFSPPPQDWPLALCEGRSVDDAEGVPNVMINLDALPDEDAAFAPSWPGEDAMPAASVFHHNPAHRWYYYPDMTRDEALLFKFYDSDHELPWRTPHTAFEDRGVTGAVPRESIEFRSIAYFAG